MTSPERLYSFYVFLLCASIFGVLVWVSLP